MCIAIYKPANKKIPYTTLETCFKNNSDGAGFMYADGKQLHMHKGFFTFKDFWQEYKKHDKKQAVIHFRIKTHGPINEANCHPFLLNKSIGFVHNGIISGFGTADHSDTYHFGEEILKPLISKWGNLSLFQPAIKSLVESRIGYSKLVFLDRHGNYDIFNEEKGVWDNDVWYSNNSYKPYIPPAPPKPIAPSYSKQTSFGYGNSYSKLPDYSKRVLKIGDLVSLSTNYYDPDTRVTYYSHEEFEVIAVNNDYTVDLIGEGAYNKKDFLYNVPCYKLDFINSLEDIAAEDDPVGANYYDAF